VGGKVVARALAGGAGGYDYNMPEWAAKNILPAMSLLLDCQAFVEYPLRP
jgi:hypothetical protein